MPRVNTYLNFLEQSEEAFAFYCDIFNPGYDCPVMRFGDLEGMPLSEEDKSKILHIELPIMNGHVLMGTDVLKSSGHEVRIGNNTTVSLEFDSREDALENYEQLAAGGSESTGMADMPWGAYWGCTLDKFGIRWMVTVLTPPSGL